MLLACLATLPSCLTHTHRVGLGPTGVGESMQRQFYVFFGLIRVNEVDESRMADRLTSYEIETTTSLIDWLLLPILLPFTFTSRTVTVKR